MSLVTIALYLHILGTMAYSAAIFINLFGLLALRRVQRVEYARPILGIMDMLGPFSGISLLLLVIAGIYMTLNTWGWQTGWIDIALGSLVLLLLPTSVMRGIRGHATVLLANQLPDGPLPEQLRIRIYDPLFGSATIMLVALILGIVFLMTVKPAWIGSLIGMGISVLLGLAFSVPLWRGERQAQKTIHPT